MTVELPFFEAMDLVNALEIGGARLGVTRLKYEEGPRPESPQDKTKRQLQEAEDKFRHAARPDGGMWLVPDALTKAADAIKALREAL